MVCNRTIVSTLQELLLQSPGAFNNSTYECAVHATKAFVAQIHRLFTPAFASFPVLPLQYLLVRAALSQAVFQMLQKGPFLKESLLPSQVLWHR